MIVLPNQERVQLLLVEGAQGAIEELKKRFPDKKSVESWNEKYELGLAEKQVENILRAVQKIEKLGEVF